MHNYKVILTVKEEYRLNGRYVGESVIVSNKEKALAIATDYKERGLHDVKVIRM